MRIKWFFPFFIVFAVCSCEKNKEIDQTVDVHNPSQSDRKSNGGLLRFTLDEKAMHDKFFEAQFTPRGEVFEYDNLQLYNYNFGSDKYPQMLINLDYRESDLKKWQDRTFPLDFMAFTASPNVPPLNSKGEIKITKVVDDKIDGIFSGKLVNPVNNKSFDIRGEFRAILKLNI